MYGCIYYINQFSYHCIYHIYHDGTVYRIYYQTVPAYNQILFHTGYIDDNMSERGLCRGVHRTQSLNTRHYYGLISEISRQLILRISNKVT